MPGCLAVHDSDCTVAVWNSWSNRYASGYADGHATTYTLHAAQAACIARPACNTVTCSINGQCTLRAGSYLYSSYSGETSYRRSGSVPCSPPPPPPPSTPHISFEAISTSPSHTCALNNGRPRCWGSSDPQILQPPSAFDLPGSATSLACGVGFTCALASEPDSRAICWGLSGHGVLPPPSMRFATGSLSASKLAGFNVACALERETNAISCWGTEPAGSVLLSTIPTGSFRQVSVGGRHACAVPSALDSRVVCWGDATDGKTSPPDQTYDFAAMSMSHVVVQVKASPTHT